MSEPIKVYSLGTCHPTKNSAPVAVVVAYSGNEKRSVCRTEDITPEGIELAAELAVKAARAKGKGRF